ncbi:MAG TPA: phosphoenolpyruvate carboxykinase (ATP) [Anaerolineales bacterium]|nr:phosphoenolpyruvate carboxykinase (ATP) [Anaerolineales bacterium]HMV96011.1 phosphoenolpyruvate carboxykinase (ATP) [Anaerolineales bacterium]HNA54873.1 phosphoenolpyruvate carboxykinase (ATP) [Anaerolineales bacterium]HNB87270.1 phosphoenolpyruvate carboxykinase (ATP) [Anaerolineales bacterium]HND92201.1 phosphoenolpyruvate carboxykinase (ATP) [Anaerolineales bacterium]
MNNLLNIKTPAESIAQTRKADYNLSNNGIGNLRLAYWNLPTEALVEEAIFRNEGALVAGGPFVANTGKHTARSANDKFVVRHTDSENNIWWGVYNRPFEADKFEVLYDRMLGFLQGRDVFVQDVYGGADESYRLPVRIVTELAWHSHFVRNMFILPQSLEEYKRFVPEFTIIAMPSFKGAPAVDSTNSETFICLSFEKKLAIIGNTAYAGEIKKSVFTILNYLLPLDGVLSMHCSANVNPDNADDVALFFGLSGTGKTTLSADPTRRLIGDDEHGWSDDGVFNFEGGCYAKVIGLSESAEPEIYATTKRFGTILENVPFDPVTRSIDLDDDTITENTRASYPLEFIDNAVPEKKAGHPKNVILLTCDASGVMPPIARLTPNQALYQFISGYTSKIAGTEVGLGKEPEITFSACFGGPFMVHHPYKYAELLKNKIERYGVTCWLVNTGWVGGPYGVGKRISIKYTRALLNAALNGKLDQVKFTHDPIFGFEVPTQCPDVPAEVLNPASSWHDQKEYDRRYKDLAMRFKQNFGKFEIGTPQDVIEAGPKV